MFALTCNDTNKHNKDEKAYIDTTKYDTARDSKTEEKEKKN